ncbi:MAG: cobalamin biosynthesis protein [Gammaproteobacteria bacterium]|nr:cobalamin biosynthesis protein [Gammaproteobacteria bacterium]
MSSADIVLLTHADSDLAALSRCVALLPEGFPRVRGFSLQSVSDSSGMAALLAGELLHARVVVVRVLGRLSGIPGWQALLHAAGERRQSLLVVSGTGEPNPELDVVSTVAPAILRETLGYLQAGGPHNLAQWLRFLADQLLLSGYGFEVATELPEHGVYHPGLGDAAATVESWEGLWGRDALGEQNALRGHEAPAHGDALGVQGALSGRDAPARGDAPGVRGALEGRDAPVVGIAFYRAHRMSGNLRFVDALVVALERRGMRALPVFTSSLRALNEAGKSAALSFFQGDAGPRIDALINTTSFAIGDINPQGPTLPGWSIAAMAELDVPVFQAIVSGMELGQWQEMSRGLNPLDTAMNVVIPEFDGRIVTVPVSFKEKRQAGGMEVVDYAPLADRVERVAGIVEAQVRLRRLPRDRRRIAFIFTNSNSKASQIGNAVGLDAPASLMALLRAMRDSGYAVSGIPESGDALIHALIDRGSYDADHLTAAQCANAVGRVSAERYADWFADLPGSLRDRMEAQWGAPPGAAYVHDGHLMLAGLELGNAIVALQPPRGYGMDPDAIYHQPDLPPTHHYYAVYRWLRDEWGAHAIVHVGKHGTLEWLPGKGVGLSEDCFPDAILGDLPLFYPFIINDPGEGAQAKRRAHAVIVDHLTPPMTTADTYGVLAQLGELVDEYYQVEMLDPSKLPLLQAQIWALVKEARLDRDLGAILGEHHHEGDDEHGHEDGEHAHGEQDHGHEDEDEHEGASLFVVAPEDVHGLILARGRGAGGAHGHEHSDEHGHDHDHAHDQQGHLHEHAHGHEGEHHHHDHDDHHGHDQDHGDDGHSHEHHWDETLNEHGVPLGLARMEGVDFAHLIEDIDGYLCEIGAAQIRDGLHTLGQAPSDGQLADMLCALTRLPNIGVPGLPTQVARYYGLDFALLLEDKGKRLDVPPDALARRAERALVTRADAVEAIEQLCRALYVELQRREFSPGSVEDVVRQCLGGSEGAEGDLGAAIDDRGGVAGAGSGVATVLRFACDDLVPNLRRTSDEIENLLRGLDGRYVPAGPSGAPTRGMAHILPTGRNFYSVDPRSLPSQAAWRVGRQLAQEVLQRYLKETGRYPESVSISVWGTSAMRTHGDDAAEILALLGVRPVWQAENRRLTGVEVVPLAELGRPRIDVTTRISGFFRDAFPQLIQLIDQAVNAVIALDESPEQNFVRKHYLAELATRAAAKEDRAQAESRARYRVFGSKPGTYGAGILPLINEKNWKDETDFAEAYVNWGGYAYTGQESGVDARPEFRQRLTAVEVALHNQDNREHDIFDSDDYLQFHGGMIATIRSLTGRKPRHYFGDTQNPDRAVVRDLKEEALRVFRSRVVNPKWLESIRRHGYKGGLECTATVDYLFGFDATAQIMEDWMYEEVAQQYALDPVMREFLEESNPWALNAIAERLLEAAQRKMWQAPKPETLDSLKEAYLESETALEARGETARRA